MKFHTSQTEILELFKAWLAISLAFTILQAGVFGSDFLTWFIISLVAVGLGFILHELGHKVVAQHYKHFAEFRAFNFMLALGILMSFLGFILIAPGAVMIQGHVTRKQNGKISIAGPLMNYILAIIFIFLYYLGYSSDLTKYGSFINAWIGLFNMIPFGNIDGAKILTWNKAAYFITLILGIILLVITGQIFGF